MSDSTSQFSNGEVAMAFLTAWIIGAGTMLGVATVAAGKVNTQGLIAAVVGGLVTAAKDYRSLKRMPAIQTNGNTETISKA